MSTYFEYITLYAPIKYTQYITISEVVELKTVVSEILTAQYYLKAAPTITSGGWYTVFFVHFCTKISSVKNRYRATEKDIRF